MAQEYVGDFNFRTIELKSEQLCLDQLRELSSTDIKELLQNTIVIFIVANIGSPLEWIIETESVNFWKNKVEMRLVEPSQTERFYLEDFPEEYCYLASEWKDCRTDNYGKSYILLKK